MSVINKILAKFLHIISCVKIFIDINLNPNKGLVSGFVFILLVFFSSNAYSQNLFLQNNLTGKLVKLDTARNITYALKSDSILYGDTTSKKLPLEEGKIMRLTDTSAILTSGYQIQFKDIIFVQQLPKKTNQQRKILSSFMIIGIGFFVRGTTMLIGEGLDSKNSELVPIQIGGGALVAGLSSIPFWKKPKKYYFNQGWIFIQTYSKK